MPSARWSPPVEVEHRVEPRPGQPRARRAVPRPGSRRGPSSSASARRVRCSNSRQVPGSADSGQGNGPARWGRQVPGHHVTLPGQHGQHRRVRGQQQRTERDGGFIGRSRTAASTSAGIGDTCSPTPGSRVGRPPRDGGVPAGGQHPKPVGAGGRSTRFHRVLPPQHWTARSPPGIQPGRGCRMSCAGAAVRHGAVADLHGRVAAPPRVGRDLSPFIRNESGSSSAPAPDRARRSGRRRRPRACSRRRSTLRSDLNAPSSWEWHWMMLPGVERAAVTDGDEASAR